MDELSVNNKCYYSVVIPVYNEEQNIPVLYTRLTAVMEKLGKDYEIVFVDDGSRDSSFEILRQLFEEDKRIKIIQLTRNFGQHPAVTAGFQNAKGRIIITLDADLQNPPEEIPKLINKLVEGYDVVTGWRTTRKDSFLRKIPSLVINQLVSRFTGVKLRDYGCMLRVYRKEVIEMLKQFPERSTYITALVSWLGVNIAEVEVNHDIRNKGRSKYNFSNLSKLYFNLMTGFSIVPLQLINFMGAFLSLIGMGLGVYLMIMRFIYGAGITGMTSFFAALLFLFGIQLLMLGIIGEYVGRIYIEAQARPYYLIKSYFEHKDNR